MKFMDAEPVQVETSTSNLKLGLFSELWAKRAFIAKFLGALILFFLLNFALQYYIYSADAPSEELRINQSFVRGYSYSGTILLALSLMLGPLAVLFPKYNYVKYRRAVGAGGFLLIYLHFLVVMVKYFNFDSNWIFGNLNPFANPLFMGFIAMLVLLPVFLTSTDWATRKLGFKRWKFVNRFVYFGFLLSILHYSLQLAFFPALLNSLISYILIALTVIAGILQVAAFIKRIRLNKAQSIATWAGVGIILFYVIFLSLAIFFKSIVT